MKVTMTSAKFNSLLRPCVYILRKQDKVLYVGASNNGYRRLFGNNSDSHRNRRDAFEDFDTVEVLFFSTARKAFAMETRLIHEYHPAWQTCEVCQTDWDAPTNKRQKRLENIMQLSI